MNNVRKVGYLMLGMLVYAVNNIREVLTVYLLNFLEEVFNETSVSF